MTQPLRPFVRRVSGALFSVVALFCLVTPRPLGAAPVAFDIPAQSVRTALEVFMRQSGMQVAYPASEIGDKRTSALSGTYEPNLALAAMLRDSGLTMTERAPGQFAIAPTVRKDIETLEKVEVSETKVQPYTTGNMDLPRTVDDVKPYYIFSAATIEQSGSPTTEEFLRSKLTMMSSFTSTLRTTVGGTSDVTGTSGSVAMRGLSSAQTVILVDGRRLINLADSPPDINSVPVSMIERIEVLPSSASGIYGGGAVGGVVNIITKRNYAGGEFRFTYDNTFKSDTGKQRTDLNYGFTLFGGRTQIMLSASYADGNPLAVGDREGLLRSYIARAAANNPAILPPLGSPIGFYGTTPRVQSQNAVPLVLKAQYGGQSLGSAFVYLPAGYRGVATSGAAPLLANAGKDDPVWPDTAQAYNGKRYGVYNLPLTKSLRANVRQRITPWLDAFLEASTDQNRNTGFWSAITFGAFTLPATVPSNPFNQTVTVLIPSAAADQSILSPLNRRRYVGGLSARLPHDWLIMADYSWNGSSNAAQAPRNSQTPLINAATAGTLDLFVDPRAVPLNFGPAMSTSFYSYASNLRETVLRGAGPLPKLFWIQPSLATGIQWRREFRDFNYSYTIYPENAPLNSASVSLPGLQEVTGYYGELTVPLVPRESGRPGLRLLELQLTGRRDEYNTGLQRVQGTGSTFISVTTGVAPGQPLPPSPALEWKMQKYASTNPTYGARYKPVEDVMVRVSYAKGFLPPTASQLVPGIPSTTPTTILDPRRGGTSVAVFADPVGGNPNLTPETSDNWSAGVVFTPRFLPGLRFAVDYTFIKKVNNISTLQPQVIVNSEAQFPGRVRRGPAPAGDPFGVGPITGIDTTALNLFSTALETYDYSLSYQKMTATRGTFAFEALATVSEHYRQRITLGAPLLEYVGTPNIAGGPLKLRTNLSATWTFRQWQAGWSAVYYDSYKVYAAPFTTSTTPLVTNGGPTVPSQATHDVFVRYRFGTSEHGVAAWRRPLDRTELLVGVRNIFNKAPAFDGGGSIGTYYMSPLGDARQASYYMTLKRGF